MFLSYSLGIESLSPLEPWILTSVGFGGVEWVQLLGRAGPPKSTLEGIQALTPKRHAWGMGQRGWAEGGKAGWKYNVCNSE